MSRFISSLVLSVLLFGGAASAATAPTPVPGGANQLAAVEGSVGATLFNGEVRIRGGKIRAATPDEVSQILPPQGKRVIVYTATMSNGAHQAFTGMLAYSLVDADGVVVDAEPRHVEPNPPPNVPQGGAWHEKVSFIVPADYTPVKLVITEPMKTNQRNKVTAFRLSIDRAALQ